VALQRRFEDSKFGDTPCCRNGTAPKLMNIYFRILRFFSVFQPPLNWLFSMFSAFIAVRALGRAAPERGNPARETQGRRSSTSQPQ
jgi:hypothetical protein